MTTGQTMLTIFAFGLLSTVLVNFYRLLGATGDDLASGQDGILATTITTSYMEIANGLAFDEVTDTSNIAYQNPSALTSSDALGPDAANEDSIHKFDDFDDFNNFQVETTPRGTNHRYTTKFVVHYVDPTNVRNTTNTRTFTKRIDSRTWRSYPPPAPGARVDTLTMSLVMGYFHFD